MAKKKHKKHKKPTGKGKKQEARKGKKQKDRQEKRKDKQKDRPKARRSKQKDPPKAFKENREKRNKSVKKNNKKGAKRKKNGKKPLYEVTTSPIHGTGVFALRKIRKGTLIGEYTGEIISDDEASERYVDEEMETHHTFLFAVDDDVVIDAGVGGSDVRFINHSCDPNCQSYMDDDDRVFIEAIRTIAPGEELTYDYQLDRDGTPDESWDRLYACRCGARNCRGTMLAEITEE